MPSAPQRAISQKSPARNDALLRTGSYLSILFTGAIFGFFFAWICSTMWGLDNADPRVAISAMQAMNASVRNAVFFPAFFLTPVVLGVTAWRARALGLRDSATLFGLAAVVYLLGGALLTMVLNVPMNEELGQLVVPTSIPDAARIWDDYSGRWQVYNVVRTVLSGVALMLATAAIRTHCRSTTS